MKTLLSRYKNDFLAHLEEIEGASPLTVKTYNIALEEMLEVAEVEEAKISILYLMPFRQKIHTQHKKTIAKKLSAVRSFVSFVNEIKKKPLVLKDDTAIKVSKTLPKPIEHKYIMQALEVATADERLLVMMLYLLGLRISELTSLELNNIKERWIRVVGKGQKTRDIPLPGFLKALMDEYLQNTQAKRFFFELKEQKLSEDSLRYKLMKVFKRIGIKATPHQLRHSYATGLLNGGARIEDVSELLGHESIATTQIYTQLASNLKMKNYLASHPLGKIKER
ncbi:MAG: tyrosine-type recombinase/integrase [Thiovulaceae bacterium]|nr:tyrosine-type recombinase/integrase [Sulfurimonadaceae bacterium]